MSINRVDAATVLTVNVGSSSLRLATFSSGNSRVPVAEHRITRAPPVQDQVLEHFLSESGITAPDIVVHRVVHGGSRLRNACLIDAEVEAEIVRLGSTAPLHNRPALDWIRVARQVVDAPQAAVFDTAFFSDLPEWAAGYALPAELCERSNIRRFGFHGLAHQDMLEEWQRTQAGWVRTRDLPAARFRVLHGGHPQWAARGDVHGILASGRIDDVDPLR